MWARMLTASERILTWFLSVHIQELTADDLASRTQRLARQIDPSYVHTVDHDVNAPVPEHLNPENPLDYEEDFMEGLILEI